MGEAPGAANRVVSLVSAIWNWAARRRIVSFEANPARGIERNPEVAAERFLTALEFYRIGDALREAETIGLPYEVDETKPRSKHAPKPDNRRVMLDPLAVARDPALDPYRRAPRRNSQRAMAVCGPGEGHDFSARIPKPARSQFIFLLPL